MEQMEQRVRCLFQPIPGVGDVEEGGKQISCYGGAPTNLLEQGDCLQAFLMSLVQLSGVYICSGQPGHHPERHQVVPCLAERSLPTRRALSCWSVKVSQKAKESGINFQLTSSSEDSASISCVKRRRRSLSPRPMMALTSIKARSRRRRRSINVTSASESKSDCLLRRISSMRVMVRCTWAAMLACIVSVLIWTESRKRRAALRAMRVCARRTGSGKVSAQ